MSVFKVFKLSFPDGLHTGDSGYGYESADWMIHSDKLFGALCHTTNLLYGAKGVEDLLSSDLRISSCFPFTQQHLFFPTPLKDRDWSALEKFEDQKKIRKAKLLPQFLFEKDLQGELNLEEWQQFEATKKASLFEEIERPRVTVDRITNAAQIFHFAEVHYPSNHGLFFLLQFGDQDDATFQNRFLAALRLLGEEGIGSDITIGKGRFLINETEVTLAVPPTSTTHVLLSLFNPTLDELSFINPQESRYKYLTRNGWIKAQQVDLRRKSVRMLIEGSCLHYEKDKQPKGRTLTVLGKEALGFEVKRYGKALSLPILINK